MADTLEKQVTNVVSFIVCNSTGEPYSATEAQARLHCVLRQRDSYKTDIEDLSEALECWKEQPDVWDRVENWLFNCKRHISDISPVVTLTIP